MPRLRCKEQPAVPGLSVPGAGGTDYPPKSVKKWKTMVNLKINKHFRPPVGAVSNRTASALLETVPTQRQNGRIDARLAFPVVMSALETVPTQRQNGRGGFLIHVHRVVTEPPLLQFDPRHLDTTY